MSLSFLDVVMRRNLGAFGASAWIPACAGMTVLF
jgi:hypothetical protein